MEYYVYVYADPRFQYADPIKIGIEFEPIYIGKGEKLKNLSALGICNERKEVIQSNF